MIFNIAVKIALGKKAEQTVTEMDGVKTYRPVQAVYETVNYRCIGYIEKRRTRSTWAAYDKDRRELGLYTSRESAIHYTIRSLFSR